MIELLIYISIVSLILVLAINFISDIIQGDNISSNSRQVQQSSRFVMEKINRILKNAVRVNTPGTGYWLSTLEVSTDDPATTPTDIYLLKNSIYIKEGASPAYRLLPDDVKALDLKFSNLSYADKPAIIKTIISLAYNNLSQNPLYDWQTDLTSSTGLNHNTRAMILRPNALGSETAFNSVYPLNTAHWEAVNEEIPNDTVDYAGNTNSGSFQRDLYNIADPQQASGPINFIGIHLRVLGGIYGFHYHGFSAASLRINNITYDSLEYNLSDYGAGSAKPWLDLVYYWKNNPNTQNSWTWNDINNLQIGAKLKSLANNYYVLLTQVYLEINYGNKF